MRTTVPPAFSLGFTGPEGPYTVRFEPVDEWEGEINVCIGGLSMCWQVVNADEEDNGSVVLSGMTDGSGALWSDQFWFELHVSATPPLLRYWGNQIVWREDNAA